MYLLRPGNERGHTQAGWLNSYHTFSFGNYYDPNYMGFSDLRVINDDVVQPKEGFGTHPHSDMEIVSIVLEGALEHKDSMGNGSTIYAGEVQKMSAGTGILHSEFNHSDSELVHFLQIWLLPNQRDLEPMYDQKKFKEEDMTNQLLPIVTPEGKDNTIIIYQDAEIYQTLLEEGKSVNYKMNEERKYWIHVATGSITVNNTPMIAGDGMAIVGEKGDLEIKGIDKKSNVLLFNLAK